MPERDELLESTHDGIQEFDNDLPRWWISLFWITIVFGVVYVGYLHLGPGLDQHEKLAVDMEALNSVRAEKEQAKAKTEVGEEALLALLQDAPTLEQGKKVFAGKCVACHLDKGQGLVGPNLTDDYWIHGGTLVDIRKVVITGVPAKGMVPWKGVLTDKEIDSVVVYIRSLRGSNPPNPKAPEAEAKLVKFD